MRVKKIIQILTLFIITLWYVPSHAQQTATAVMNVTVEVIEGSSIEMNQNELITFNETTSDEVIFAIFSITNNQENTILTSASETIQMMNGMDSAVMMSTFKEKHHKNGQLTLEFSTGSDNSFTSGFYTGKQIAEIIYL